MMPYTQRRVMRITRDVQSAVECNDLGKLAIHYPTYSFIHKVEDIRGTPNDEAIVTACMYGRVQVLNWLHNDPNGPRLSAQVILEDSLPAMQWAAQEGHLNVLQWFYMDPDGPWMPRDYFLKGDCLALCAAAANGHISILEWLCFDQEGPLITREELCGAGENLVMAPAHNGWTDVLEWLFLDATGPRVPLYHLTARKGVTIALYESKFNTLNTPPDHDRGGVDALRWYRDKIAVTDADSFRAHDNELLVHCCERGYAEAIKWLCLCEEGPQLGEDDLLDSRASNIVSIIERRQFDLLQELLDRVLKDTDRIVHSIDRVWEQLEEDVQRMMFAVFPRLSKWNSKYAPWESSE